MNIVTTDKIYFSSNTVIRNPKFVVKPNLNMIHEEDLICGRYRIFLKQRFKSDTVLHLPYFHMDAILFAYLKMSSLKVRTGYTINVPELILYIAFTFNNPV